MEFAESRKKRFVHRRKQAFIDRNEQAELQPEPSQTELIQTERRFAGFWMRLWAFLLDSITIFALNGFVFSLLLDPIIHGEEVVIFSYTAQALLAALIAFLYYAIMTKFYGQTIGKMVMGLKVVSKEGTALTWTQVIFREGIGRLLHQLFFFLYLLYIIIAFTSNKQGLHDMIAETFVIHE